MKKLDSAVRFSDGQTQINTSVCPAMEMMHDLNSRDYNSAQYESIIHQMIAIWAGIGMEWKGESEK